MPLWLESNLYEEDAPQFRDWRADRPLPSDFEFQYAEVASAEPVSVDPQPHDSEKSN